MIGHTEGVKGLFGERMTAIRDGAAFGKLD